MQAAFFLIIIVIFVFVASKEVTDAKYLLVQIRSGAVNNDKTATTPELAASHTVATTLKAPEIPEAPIVVPKNNITSNDINGRQSINPFSGRSSRQSRYESPLERMFCDFINRDTHYDICVIDCQSNWRGEVQECTETVWEKKCGCNQGPPKSVGVMKYRNGRLINDEIDSPGCRAHHKNNRCEGCYRGIGWTAESYATWTDSSCGIHAGNQRGEVRQAECKDKDEKFCISYVRIYANSNYKICEQNWFISDAGRYGCKKSCNLCDNVEQVDTTLEPKTKTTKTTTLEPKTCEDKDAKACPYYVKIYGDSQQAASWCKQSWFISDGGRYGCRKSCNLC